MMGRMTYPWGHARRFNAYSNYIHMRFGGRIQKLSIDAGFTCPNRDGTKGTGGCSFCNNEAFRPSYCTPSKSVQQQIQEGIDFHRTRYRRTARYMAYFQAYSNTYAPLSQLKQRYAEALEVGNVIGLVIGTRPDCVNEDTLDYLSHLSQEYYVVLEYGIESCYEKTLVSVNRHHTFEDSVAAIRMTAAKGIPVGVHIIFGLPGETRQQMLDEAGILSQLPLHSLKLHQLQIIRNTIIEKQYTADPGSFCLFGLDEYVDFIVQFVERLNPAIMIERFAGEAPPRYNSGPKWGLRNDRLLGMIERRLEEKNTWQGKYYNG